MNYLILINNAPDYRPYYIKLGQELKNRGHNVFYVLDSKITDYLYPQDVIEDPIEYFSRYFKDNYYVPLNPSLCSINQATLLFADMERFYYYGLHRDKDLSYWSSLKNCLLNFIADVIIKYSIDAVIYENVSNALAFSAYLVCQQFGKRYIGLASSRLPYAVFEIHRGVDVSAEFADLSPILLDDTKQKLATDYLHKLQKKSVQPAYMLNNTTSINVSYLVRYLSLNKLTKFITLLKYVANERREIIYSFQNSNPLKLSLNYALRNIVRKLRTKRIAKYLNQIDPVDHFFLYPLHFHPESSTSLLAPEYVDEISLIRKLSLSLPNNTWLYVKEHPNAYGYNRLDFYQQLRMLPNVKLIAYQNNTFDLLLQSIAVITLTSTVGYEALLYHKKALVFGDVFYKLLPNCIYYDGKVSLDKILMKLFFDKQNTQSTSCDLKIDTGLINRYLNFVKHGELFSFNENDIRLVIDAIEEKQ